jgi:hypothetical protein
MYDSGLIAWLRHLPELRPRNQIDRRDAMDQRYSSMAVTHGLVTLHELPDSTEEEDRPYALVVRLTPLGSQALQENP